MRSVNVDFTERSPAELEAQQNWKHGEQQNGDFGSGPLARSGIPRKQSMIEKLYI